jgi:RNA polymerase sigma factor (TIGR02999 family)
VDSRSDITQLLNQWVDGDEDALSSVTPLIYDELKTMAQRLFSRESSAHTLQPTALVHEAYEKLIDVDAQWQSRAHFYALAARMMRRLLVNHAKSRRAEKRGGDALHVTLHEELNAGHSPDEDILELDAALAGLAGNDERKSAVLELHYFGGLTHEETALALDISESTVRRELRVAKIWLRKALKSGSDQA